MLSLPVRLKTRAHHTFQVLFRKPNLTIMPCCVFSHKIKMKHIEVCGDKIWNCFSKLLHLFRHGNRCEVKRSDYHLRTHILIICQCSSVAVSVCVLYALRGQTRGAVNPRGTIHRRPRRCLAEHGSLVSWPHLWLPGSH